MKPTKSIKRVERFIIKSAFPETYNPIYLTREDAEQDRLKINTRSMTFIAKFTPIRRKK